MKKLGMVSAVGLLLALGLSLSCQSELKVTAIGGSIKDGVTGAPLAGATISFTVPGTYFKDYKKMLASTTSGTDGRWFLENLPPNVTIRISFSATGFKTYELDVLTPGDDDYREITVTLYQYFTQDEDPQNAVYGTLYDANTSLPISGAAVHLEFRNGGIVVDATTDTAGNFWIGGLAAEGFDITVSMTGYHSLVGRINWCGGLNLGNPNATDEIWCGDLDLGNIYLGSTATLTAEVADEDGNPLASAQVILIPDCTGLCAEDVMNGTTDANGAVNFDVTLGAVYTITAVSSDGSLRGYLTGHVDFPVTYLGIDCGAAPTDTLSLVSSNREDNSAGGVLRLVFDQPVQVVGVELGYWHDLDHDGLAPDFSGVNDGATFTLASGGYQLLISPLLTASSGSIESGDEFWYNWEVKSTVTDDTEEGSGYRVRVP